MPRRQNRPPTFDASFREHLEQLIVWRRDVRHFRSEPLPDGLIDDLLHLAVRAPSVGLSEPWRFVIVDDPERRVSVIRNFETSNTAAAAIYDDERAAHYRRLKLAGLREAPVHLAVFCDASTSRGSGLGRQSMPEMLAYSVVTAVHTFWLAARAHGVGVGWVSILDPAAVVEILDVPTDWRLIAYLCVGYPTDSDDTPELERCDWERRADLRRVLLRR